MLWKIVKHIETSYKFFYPVVWGDGQVLSLSKVGRGPDHQRPEFPGLRWSATEGRDIHQHLEISTKWKFLKW
jgi:hypothetical protein